MTSPARRCLIAILLLSVLLRVGVALYLGDTVPPAKDELSYSLLAERLATGHGYSFDRPWYPFTPADTPTAHWSFLYTAFVAGVYALVGPHPLAARLIQAMLTGLLLPWLTFRLARRATCTPRRGVQPATVPLLAAFLSAIYAYFVLYGAMVQTEAFYICALLWSLERTLALGKALRNPQPSTFNLQPATLLGLSLGIATLLRQSILPWVVVLFAWLLWRALGLKVAGWKVTGETTVASPLPSQGGGRGVGDNSSNSCNSWLIAPLATLLVAGGVLLACIAPFTIRNYVAYGDFLLLNSNAGYAMYSAQHPTHGTSFQEYAAAPLPEDLAGQDLNEAQWDKALMRRGIGFVLAEPGRYLLLSLSRVRDYFEFWPTADSSLLFNVGRVASIGIFSPFMLYGIWLVIRRGQALGSGNHGAGSRNLGAGSIQPSTFNPSAGSGQAIQPSTFLLVFVVFYSLLHIATWAMSRYRLPVDAVLLIFAALGIADLVERWKVRTGER